MGRALRQRRRTHVSDRNRRARRICRRKSDAQAGTSRHGCHPRLRWWEGRTDSASARDGHVQGWDVSGREPEEPGQGNVVYELTSNLRSVGDAAVVAVQDAGEAAMAAGTVVEDRSDFKRVL